MRKATRCLALLAVLCLLLPLAGASGETGARVSGKAIPADVAEVDLRNVKLRDEKELMRAMASLPRVRTVYLEGSGLKLKSLAALSAAYPGVLFSSPFTLFGRAFHTSDTEIDLGSAKMTGYQSLLWAVQSMPNLKKLTAFGASLNQKRYEALLAARPGLELNCTLSFLTYSLRTDATAFSTRKGNHKPFYKNSDFDILKYVPGLLALDLGHNHVNDLTFLRQWPRLKILIMADNNITDLSVIEELAELEYLELFMNPITDVTPLQKLTKLKDLNISWTSVRDVSPLMEMTWLERLWLTQIKPRLPAGQVDALRAALPDTEINDTAWLSTQGGWREHPRYLTQANIFGLQVYRGWDDPKPEAP